MHETYVTEETYSFICSDCGHQWSASYQARHSQDPDGDELCIWSRAGFPSLAPDAGMLCPSCSGVRTLTNRNR